MRTPQVYFAAIEAAGAELVLLLEDLGPARECDQLPGCSIDQATPAMEQAGALHGSSRGDRALPCRPWPKGMLRAWQHIGEAMAELAPVWRERYDEALEPEYLASGRSGRSTAGSRRSTSPAASGIATTASTKCSSTRSAARCR